MENGKSRLQQVQDDVEDVKHIMLDNMNKAKEREGKLSELDDRAEDLLEKGKLFEKKTQKVKQQKMWEDKKTKIIFASVGAVVLVVLLALIIYASVGLKT